MAQDHVRQAAAGAADGVNIIAAGTQTAATTGTVVFSNSNNVTFGMTNSSIVTASISVPAQTNQSLGIYGSSQTTGQSSSSTYDARSLTIVGQGIISVGWSNSSLLISATAGGGGAVVSNALQDVSTATGSGTNTSRFAADDHVHRGMRAWQASGTATTFFGDIMFSSGNLISLNTGGNSTAGSLGIINLVSSATTVSQVASANAVGAMASRFALEAHQHAGVPAIAPGSNTGNTAGNTATQFGTWVIAGSNQATVSGSSGAAGIHTAWVNVTTAAQTNQTLGIYASSVTTGESSSSTYDARSLTIIGKGIASVGWSNSSLIVSVPSGGGGGDGGNTIAAGTRTASTSAALLFSDANGVSFGLNAVDGTIMTASVAAGGGHTYDQFAPFDEVVNVVGQVGQGSMFIQPLLFPDVQFDHMLHRVHFTATSNSTGSMTMTIAVNFYTRLDANTLSRWGSTSHSYALTFSGTAGAFSLNAGPRVFSIPWTTTVPADEYFVGVASSTSTGGGGATMSNIVISQMNSTFSGVLGKASASTDQRRFGQGIWTGVGTTSPVSIAISHIRGNSSAFQRGPIFLFLSQTTT